MIHFNYQHDMIECVQKINGKKNEDFKLLYLMGGPTEQENLQTTKISKCRKDNKTHNHLLTTQNPPITKENCNPLGLSNKRTDWGIGMLVGTFPGDNRREQLSILASSLQIPEYSDLISLEHINGNSWFTCYSKKNSSISVTWICSIKLTTNLQHLLSMRLN